MANHRAEGEMENPNPMMSSDFYFRDKIPVAVLGATGKMGQRLIQQLVHHPWFEIAALCDESQDLIGQPYGKFISKHSLPDMIQNIRLQPCEAPFLCSIIFSFLHSPEAYVKEELWAQAGYFVISSSAYQVQDHIPLIVAEINGNQLALLQGNKGGVIASPHSVVCGLSLALKPLMEKFGLNDVQATLSQLSNKGDAKDRKEEVSSNQEMNTEIEQQSLLILGYLEENDIQKASFKISVQGRSLPEGDKEHILVSVKLQKQAQVEELIQAWCYFRSESQRLPLPTAPFHPLYYLSDPQLIPTDKEMSVYIEQLCQCSVLDYKFNLSFSHTMRGLIGSMLLNAELLVAQGNIYW